MAGIADPEGAPAPRLPRWIDGSDARSARPGAGRRIVRTRRDWLVDALAVVVSVVVGVLPVLTGIATSGPLGADVMLALNLALGLPAIPAIWLRRRWPVPLAVVLALAAAVSPLAGGAATVALFTVVVHAAPSRAWPVVVLNVATLPLYGVLYPDPELPWWATLAIGAAFLAVVVAWGFAVRSRRALVRSLWERAARAEAEQQALADRARGQERARIAREMHDVLAHRISLLSLHAGALEFRADASPQEVQRAAGVIRASAHQALEDLREVIGVLREDGDDGGGERPQPGVDDLPALVEESRAAGMRVRTDWDLGALDALPASVGRSAYRIVQEALTNARKHASGTVVEVRLAGAPGDGLVVEATNPLPAGAGTPARVGGAPAVPVGGPVTTIPGAGTGLVGLAERATLSGGELEHGTVDGRFRLRARLAWPA